jgi:hypothetical protein
MVRQKWSNAPKTVIVRRSAGVSVMPIAALIQALSDKQQEAPYWALMLAR